MKSKLIYLMSILMLSSTLLMAQNADRTKISFAILGGVNFLNLNGKDASGDKLNNDMILGYHIGANMLIPIVPQFYFQPGLMFTTKGAKNNDDLIKATYNLSYIEMPLNFVYRGALGSGFVTIGFGPYIGYGIGGKAKFEAGSVSVTNDIKFKNTVNEGDDLTVAYFKALDVGANVFAGYEFANGVFVQINTQLGLLNISPKDNRFSGDDPVIKNTGFGLSAGYRF